jgi:hypothetical protein
MVFCLGVVIYLVWTAVRHSGAAGSVDRWMYGLASPGPMRIRSAFLGRLGRCGSAAVETAATTAQSPPARTNGAASSRFGRIIVSARMR